VNPTQGKALRYDSKSVFAAAKTPYYGRRSKHGFKKAGPNARDAIETLQLSLNTILENQESVS